MNKLLQGKRGIIFGALDEQSIAWKVALAAHQHGAVFTLTNAPVALRLGSVQQLAEQCGALLLPADATSTEDLKKLLSDSIQHLGGKIDFILHSVGMSPNVRKNRTYTELNYEWFQKTLDVSAMSLHKLLQEAYQMDALNPQGSVVALTYIAAQRVFPGYGDMAEAKAMLESVVRSFGFYYGRHNGVRVNSVSQSPTITTAGSGIKGFDSFYNFADKMSPLGNADAEACADYCISLFSDLTRMVTMQNLFHDGGFSSSGVTQEVMDLFQSDSGKA